MTNLTDKKRIAHLEAVNAMAIETIKQIETSYNNSTIGKCHVTLEEINQSINWFNKYGCTELRGKPNEKLLYDSFIKWHNSDEYLTEYNPGAWEMECRFRIWLHLSK